MRNLLVAVTKKVVKVTLEPDSFELEFGWLFCGFMKCITGHRSLRHQLLVIKISCLKMFFKNCRCLAIWNMLIKSSSYLKANLKFPSYVLENVLWHPGVQFRLRVKLSFGCIHRCLLDAGVGTKSWCSCSFM